MMCWSEGIAWLSEPLYIAEALTKPEEYSNPVALGIYERSNIMQLIIIFAVVAVLILYLLIRICPELFAFLYCVGTGILLAFVLLHDGSDEATTICLALGGGVGALIGLLSAFLFHAVRPNIPFGTVIGLFILAPIVELILGFVVFLILGVIATAMHGNADDLLKGAALFLALLGGVFGGGGTVYVIFFKD